MLDTQQTLLVESDFNRDATVLGSRFVKRDDGLESGNAECFKPGNSALREFVEMRQNQSKAEHAIAKHRRIGTEPSVHEPPEMLAASIQASDEAIISETPKGIIETWDKGAERMFGYPAVEAIGQSACILFSADCMAKELEVLARATRGERIEHFETVRIRRDRVSIHVSVTIAPIVNIEGTITGISTIARDITERKRAESLQRDHSKMLEYAPFLVSDMDGRIVEWSPGAERLYGYPRGEALGQRISEFLRTTFPQPLEVIRDGLLSNDFWEGRLTRRKRNGAELMVTSMWVLQRDAIGQPHGVLEIATDVTDRLRTDQKLIDQEFRLGFFANVARAIGARQDLTGALQVATRELEKHLAIAFSCICLYDPQKRRLTVAAIGSQSRDVADNIGLTESVNVDIGSVGLARSLRGDHTYEPDLVGVHAPFLQRLASSGVRALVAAPLRIEGETFGILITGRREPRSFSSSDCEFLMQLSEHVALATRQTMLNGALLVAYEELRRTQATVIQRELMRVLAQMADGIAHDINNALSPAAIYADMLLARDGSLDPESREYLNAIQAAIETVAGSVARMTGFYREHEPQATRA
jgi:PAS domain S-box-containing protein